MTLLELRKQNKISQAEAANIIGVPIRTYRRYESNEIYGDKIKRASFVSMLNEHFEITEEKGILSIETIKNELQVLFDDEYKGTIEFCYLFGSYAKGNAKDNSDVDLYISSNLQGLRFVGLIERIRQVLNKKVDLIRSSELENNIDLVNELLKTGIKIYRN